MLNQNKINKLVTNFILLLNETEGPIEACQLFGGVLANIAGPVPNKSWNLILEESRIPCGEPGCNCQIIKQDLIETLNNLRKDWREEFGYGNEVSH